MTRQTGVIDFFYVEAICPYCGENADIEQSEVKTKVVTCSECNEEFDIDFED